MPHTRNAPALAALVALTAVLVTGCSSSPAPPAASPEVTTGASPTARASDRSTCEVSSLSATLGQGPDVTPAGSGSSITLTNNAATGCVMQGYVSLSYLSGKNGPAIGTPARHDDSDTFPEQPVSLAPGGSAVVVFSSVESHDSSCAARPLWGYRLVLPGQSAPLTVNLLGTNAEKVDTGITICPDSYMVLAPVQDPAHL